MRPRPMFGGGFAFDAATIYMVPMIGRHGFENRLGPEMRQNIPIPLPLIPNDVYESLMRNVGNRQIGNLSCD